MKVKKQCCYWFMLQQKVALLRTQEANPDWTQAQLVQWVVDTFALKHPPSLSVVNRINATKDKLLQAPPEGLEKRKTLHEVSMPKLEEKLWNWCKSCQESNCGLTSELILEKARLILQQLGHQEENRMKLSNGWLWRFQERHGLRLLHVNKNETKPSKKRRKKSVDKAKFSMQQIETTAEDDDEKAKQVEEDVEEEEEEEAPESDNAE